MPQRKAIKIKTKYMTKDDCMENCRDITRKTRLSTNYSRQISGEVYPDGSFVLSSRAKGSSMFEFKGMIQEEDDGVYMIGDIKKKAIATYIVYLSIIISEIIALSLVMTLNPVFILFALFFFTLPWLNLIYLSRSDSLYKDLVNKVG